MFNWLSHRGSHAEVTLTIAGHAGGSLQGMLEGVCSCSDLHSWSGLVAGDMATVSRQAAGELSGLK